MLLFFLKNIFRLDYVHQQHSRGIQMDKVTQVSQKAGLIALSQSNAMARTLFQSLAMRDRDSAETSVDRIMTILNSDRNTAIWLMKEVAEIGVADFYSGRRGHKTRLVWHYSCKSVGEAALEQFASLQIPQLADETGDNGIPEAIEVARESPIIRAKRLLVAELGVKMEDVDIVIRG
jgi:hypothetical protein